jgi:hydrogenase maturation factor
MEGDSMNVLVTAHLKQSYEIWKKLFDDDTARAEFCDESRTMVGKVDDKTALVALFGVDREKMNTRLASAEFAEMVEDYVVKHDAFVFEKISIG